MKRTWLVVSVVAHLGLLGAYIVHGMWKIEKVSFERPPVQLAAMSPMAVEDPMAGLEPGAKPKDPPKPATKQVTDDLTQPDPTVTPDPAATTTTTTTTTDANTPPGGGGGGTPGDKTTIGSPTPCLDPNGCAEGKEPPRCQGDSCGVTTRPFVPPRELRKKLIAGETQIVPDHPTKIAMQHAGHDRAVGVVKYCIDTDGRVTSAKVERSTGYPDYDARLVDGVLAWKFRPHTIGTTPIAACSTVNFELKMK